MVIPTTLPAFALRRLRTVLSEPSPPWYRESPAIHLNVQRRFSCQLIQHFDCFVRAADIISQRDLNLCVDDVDGDKFFERRTSYQSNVVRLSHVVRHDGEDVQEAIEVREVE